MTESIELTAHQIEVIGIACDYLKGNVRYSNPKTASACEDIVSKIDSLREPAGGVSWIRFDAILSLDKSKPVAR